MKELTHIMIYVDEGGWAKFLVRNIKILENFCLFKPISDHCKKSTC